MFQIAPMHVNHAREVPEYEIDPKELDFTNSVEITKVITVILILLVFLFLLKVDLGCPLIGLLGTFLN